MMKLRNHSLVGLAVMLPLTGAACAPRSAMQNTELLPSVAAQTRSSEPENRPTQAPPDKAPVAETPAVRDAAAIQNSFAQVATAANPAVVTITTERRMPR